IFAKQLFGIAITELTALMSRRTVYGSKKANGKYSFCDAFSDEEGNIRYKRIKHTWKDGRCIYCGTSQQVFDRGDDAETYAYNFIHLENPLELFNQPNMKFNVIIGNPPYQLKDGGGRGSSAKPIYHLFIEQAKKLNPRYLCMIIPARWYSGGKGLDDFRNKMLADRRIKKLVDYEDSRDCFPGVDIAGGICYFLWQNDYDGICEVENIRKSQKHVALRFLDEYETFIRDNLAIRIVQKVKENCDSFLDDVVSSRMPFGIPSNAPFDDDGDLNLITNSGRGKILSRRVTKRTRPNQ
ncbi:MAG: Eco57I restriction-modification methylase domain-containing protein, partial [Chloroherpetonaceae bacterium]|nr:Eco57I restriction-modification methylase domain-containing protein [Chloroherpetonaceae bacterium]